MKILLSAARGKCFSQLLNVCLATVVKWRRSEENSKRCALDSLEFNQKIVFTHVTERMCIIYGDYRHIDLVIEK